MDQQNGPNPNLLRVRLLFSLALCVLILMVMRSDETLGDEADPSQGGPPPPEDPRLVRSMVLGAQGCKFLRAVYVNP
jgi:hypothetical protein